MSSIVIELQQDALNNNIAVSNILRKALVVSRKLGIKEFEEWVSAELNGYEGKKPIPEYRQIHGEIKALNPFHGWQPVFFEDTSYAETLSIRSCGQTIAEIEELVNNHKEKSFFHMPFSKEVEKSIIDSLDLATTVTLITQKTSLIRILDTVRTIVLNWALKLEEDGVLGEGLSFTTQEKQTAEQHSYNINNFYGQVSSPQIQQQPNQSTQISNNYTNDLEAIISFINSLNEKKSKLSISSEDAKELETEIETVEAQVKSPKPKRNIIKEGLNTIGKILENAGGGM